MRATITIEETRNAKLVWEIASHPAMVDRVVNDTWGAFDRETRQYHVILIVENPANHVLLVRQDGKVCGCFVLDAKGDGVLEVHTMLLPSCRGIDAIHAGKLAMQHAFKLEGVEKLISHCPENLPETLLYASLCGWRKAGVAAFKWLKNGVEFPVKIVEATKEVVCH